MQSHADFPPKRKELYAEQYAVLGVLRMQADCLDEVQPAPKLSEEHLKEILELGGAKRY